MDSRGIPIVIPAKKCNITPKRITTPKRYDTPLSPFFIRTIKNEFSLLDAYDDFYDSRFSSRYHPTSDDMRHNVRDLYKSNMFTEISSPKPPKRMRSSFFMDSDMMDDELPHLEASKKPPKDMTAASSPMEAMTPLADDALETLHDAPPPPTDLDLHHTPTSAPAAPAAPTAAAPAVIPPPSPKTKSTRKRATKQKKLVGPHQYLPPQVVTPKSLLKHQKPVESAPHTPLPPPAASDPFVNEKMPIRQKTTTLKLSATLPAAAAAAAVKPTHGQASPQRLTRRQARLMEDKGDEPDFTVPKAPAPKRKTRASKRKPSLPKQVEAVQEMQLVEKEPIVDQVPPVLDDNGPEPAIIEQQQETTTTTPPSASAKVVNAEKVSDIDMHDTTEAEEEAAAEEAEEEEEAAAEEAAAEEAAAEEAAAEAETVVEAPQAQKLESIIHNTTKTEKSEKELQQQEKLRAYQKKKSDAEIKQILQEFPQLAQYYQLIERAGSGTFSRVYKAKDLLVDDYMPSPQANKVADALGQQQDDAGGAHYVAIKLIFDISAPERVANEIRCLSMLADSPGVTPMITAFRHEGLTFVVLPYIQFDHFDDFYRDMTADDVRSYISELLIGLKSLHEKGYMHRDVKPGNFLYNVKSKVGYLADFGLARAATLKAIKPPTTTTTASTNPKVKNTQYTQKGDEIGYYAYDSRSPLQADRSGTKGFRAPEVMLRYRYQTSAIDIWAVGVILLTILSGQYPIFEPEDDANGIIELAHVFGMKQLKAFTEYYGRNIHTNIPTIPEDPIDLDAFCRDINKKGAIKMWDSQDYTAAVDLMKQCLQLVHINRPTAADALNHSFFSPHARP